MVNPHYWYDCVRLSAEAQLSSKQSIELCDWQKYKSKANETNQQIVMSRERALIAYKLFTFLHAGFVSVDQCEKWFHTGSSRTN